MRPGWGVLQALSFVQFFQVLRRTAAEATRNDFGSGRFVISVLVSARRQRRKTQGIQQCVLQRLVRSLAPPFFPSARTDWKHCPTLFCVLGVFALIRVFRDLTSLHTIGLNSRPACAMLSEIYEAQ
jgi:hypothetical protein